jgi:hypothetical protein
MDCRYQWRILLHGDFKDGKVIYTKIPHGFEKLYPANMVVKMKKCIYGLKQAAMAIWQQLLLYVKSMGAVYSTTGHYLYHKWSDKGLVLIVSWIDGNLFIGTKKAVEKTKAELMERFNCQDCGELEEYVGCKIERNGNSVKFTQPVLLCMLTWPPVRGGRWATRVYQDSPRAPPT